MNRWRADKMKKSNVLKMLLHKDYKILEKVCRADELGRLYVSDINKYITHRLYLIDMLQNIKSKDEYDSKIKALITWDMILAKKPDIDKKDIGLIKTTIIEKIVDEDFNITPEQIDLLLNNMLNV